MFVARWLLWSHLGLLLCLAAEAPAVTGTVTYRQRMALPPSAEVVLSLLDVSLQDARANFVFESKISPRGKQVPFSFRLPYDASTIQPSHTYAVRAVILDNGHLLFTTTTSYPVITHGAPQSVDMLLVPVGSPSASPASPDRWLGKWIGPEGTYLQLEQANGSYRLLIHSLDGSRTFTGHAAADRLLFTRDGVEESLRAGTGQETGMKWLLEKTNCLVIRTGEGFCR